MACPLFFKSQRREHHFVFSPEWILWLFILDPIPFTTPRGGWSDCNRWTMCARFSCKRVCGSCEGRECFPSFARSFQTNYKFATRSLKLLHASAQHQLVRKPSGSIFVTSSMLAKCWIFSPNEQQSVNGFERTTCKLTLIHVSISANSNAKIKVYWRPKAILQLSQTRQNHRFSTLVTLLKRFAIFSHYPKLTGSTIHRADSSITRTQPAPRTVRAVTVISLPAQSCQWWSNDITSSNTQLFRGVWWYRFRKVTPPPPTPAQSLLFSLALRAQANTSQSWREKNKVFSISVNLSHFIRKFQKFRCSKQDKSAWVTSSSQNVWLFSILLPQPVKFFCAREDKKRSLRRTRFL
jgi:hypothetical protein